MEGEKDGPDEALNPEKLAPVDNGVDPLRPAGLAVRDAEARYLGGVT